MGRWTSKEPLGFKGSRNFYVYVNNNPVSFRDPTGLILVIIGSEKFRKKVGDMLDKIGKISPYIKCVIDNLKNSEKIHYIAENPGDTGHNLDFIKFLPSGSLTTLDSNFSSSDLAHELWHAYTSNNGKKDYTKIFAYIQGQGPQIPGKFDTQEEADAIDFENLVNPFRRYSHYDNKDAQSLELFFEKKYKNCSCYGF